MIINDRVHKIVKFASADYQVSVKTYRRLAQGSFVDYRDKHLIVVEKFNQVGSHPVRDSSLEVVGAFRAIQDWSNKDPNFSSFPIFVPTNKPDYLTERTVFYGDKGLALANEILTKVSQVELFDSIKHYLIHTFTRKFTIELAIVIPGKEHETWTKTVAEIEEAIDKYRDARPPLYYTWGGIIFRFWMLLVNDDNNSRVIYKEIGRHD
jgi:hypothetical protein